MTRENKELLLKDLCMRLPYNVYVDRIGIPHKLIGVNSADKTVTINNKDYMPTTFFINAYTIPVKPYLRPMSSMTKEEKSYYEDRWFEGYHCLHGDDMVSEPEIPSYIDWLNKNMFDYRGLIPKGLAIEVTEQNNPYKE